MPSQKSRQFIPSKANCQSWLGKASAEDTPRAMDKSLRNAIIVGIIVSWTVFFPILFVLMVALISTMCGCSVNEGFSDACIVFATDIGRMLYALGEMGWLSIVTPADGGDRLFCLSGLSSGR